MDRCLRSLWRTVGEEPPFQSQQMGYRKELSRDGWAFTREVFKHV